jgi:hypothetical protein
MNAVDAPQIDATKAITFLLPHLQAMPGDDDSLFAFAL